MSSVTIKQFCKQFKVTELEWSKLVEHLALMRYRKTIQIPYPRETNQQNHGELES